MMEPRQTPQLSVRPYGDRWAVLSGDEVVLVSSTRAAARALMASANDVLARSGLKPEKRSFVSDGD